MNNPLSQQHDLSLFSTLCSQATDPAAFPHAADVVENIAVYSGDQLREIARGRSDNGEHEALLKAEFALCLKDGPGILVIRNAYEDLSVIDECTQILRRIVEQEKSNGRGQGDHFGNNERIWNSLQKVCVADPALFMDYYANPWLRLVSEAWLGPSYQVTAQMNNVKPGGQAQTAHRDYHLGFQTTEMTKRYPEHAQTMSQFLTLQGAVAHVDMPNEKGPTLLLPFSQQYSTLR